MFFILATRNAQPVEKLKVAYKKFLTRSMRQMKTNEVCKSLPFFVVRFTGCIWQHDSN